MKSLIIQFTLLVFCTVGCKKESLNTFVEGTLTNKITNEPVQGIPIEIIECGGYYNKCLTTLQTVYTDAKGHYNVSFKAEGGKNYKVAVGSNEVVASSVYPYYTSIKDNQRTRLDFAQFPLKVLQIRFRVLRHDKNWLRLEMMDWDIYGNGNSFRRFYFGENPINDFDTTYYSVIQAGRRYRVIVGLSNKPAPYTYLDNEFIDHFFQIENIDTTKIEIVVQ